MGVCRLLYLSVTRSSADPLEGNKRYRYYCTHFFELRRLLSFCLSTGVRVRRWGEDGVNMTRITAVP